MHLTHEKWNLERISYRFALYDGVLENFRVINITSGGDYCPTMVIIPKDKLHESLKENENVRVSIVYETCTGKIEEYLNIEAPIAIEESKDKGGDGLIKLIIGSMVKMPNQPYHSKRNFKKDIEKLEVAMKDEILEHLTLNLDKLIKKE